MVALAFLVRAIVHLADASGTQTEAVAVRGLPLSRVSPAGLVRSGAPSGRDLAFGGGPLATIIQDTPSPRIYFAIASLLPF